MGATSKSARLGRRSLQRLGSIGLRGAREDDGGFAAVDGAVPFPEAAFFGYADGGQIIWVNQADGAGIGEVGVAPREDGVDGFRGVALAVHGGSENPARFAKIFDGRGEFAMEIGETDFPGEGQGGFFLKNPEAETEERPVSGVAQEFDPGFLLGERAAADEFGDGGIGPHGAAGGEIFEAVVAQTEARGFDEGEIRSERQRLDHEGILTQAGLNFGRKREKEGVEGGVAKR